MEKNQSVGMQMGETMGDQGSSISHTDGFSKSVNIAHNYPQDGGDFRSSYISRGKQIENEIGIECQGGSPLEYSSFAEGCSVEQTTTRTVGETMTRNEGESIAYGITRREMTTETKGVGVSFGWSEFDKSPGSENEEISFPIGIGYVEFDDDSPKKQESKARMDETFLCGMLIEGPIRVDVIEPGSPKRISKVLTRENARALLIDKGLSPLI